MVRELGTRLEIKHILTQTETQGHGSGNKNIPFIVLRGSLYRALATSQLSGSFSCRAYQNPLFSIRVSCSEQLQAAQSSCRKQTV